MKNTLQETDDFTRFRHTTGTNENYYLTIFDDRGITSINLTEFNKNLLRFGKNEENDIVIQSNYIDDFQGTFSFTEYGILATNQSKLCTMISNGNNAFDNIYLQEGSFIKFINQEVLSLRGVIFILSIGKNLDEWKSYSLKVGENKLGSSGTCDIVLPPAGVAKLHAVVHYYKNYTFIQDDYSINGTYVNGIKIPYYKEYSLNNLDVIFIGNSKIILNNGKLVYQIFERGIQLDAIDIVKRVRIKFKTKQISSHVNMSIKPGEFVALVGGSGAGKSTFMKCISGVTPPTSGKVLLNGEDLYENYETLKYNIGYVPQDDIVFSNLTLIDMLNYAAKLRMPDNTSWKERAKRIAEVLDIVQLREFKDSYIRQLSGGQRKRASIAVELIADPRIIFLRRTNEWA